MGQYMHVHSVHTVHVSCSYYMCLYCTYMYMCGIDVFAACSVMIGQSQLVVWSSGIVLGGLGGGGQG